MMRATASSSQLEKGLDSNEMITLNSSSASLNRPSSPTMVNDDEQSTHHPHHLMSVHELSRRLRGEGREIPSILQSFKNLAMSSVLNVLLVFIPIAWVAHWHQWDSRAIFALAFIAIIPLEKMFDWSGEQLALYCGHSIGELVVTTMENAVEATLAIILLLKCQLRLLQATIIGVVLLHLLFIPGVSFLVGGARLLEQHLNTHVSQLNHSLLTVGVMTLLLPAAFFAATVSGPNATLPALETDSLLTHNILAFSRGLAVILLVIYIGSRIFLFNPPGDDNALQLPVNAPHALHERERELAEKTPKMNPFICVFVIAVTIALMAVTAEFLVSSVEKVIEESHMKEEFIGLIILPFASYSADALITTIYFIRRTLFLTPRPPDELAKSSAIDLSIQFTLFWMPFLILLSWWTHRPLTLLFDLFEVALVIGACLLVNYITADSKTNWAEGMMMVCFYVMVALVAWFYDGQPLVFQLLNQGRCLGLLNGPEHQGAGSEGGVVHEGGGGGAVPAE